MTALDERAGAPEGTDAPDPHGERPGRDFGPVRWVPRLLVLVPLAYWILFHIPNTSVMSAR